MKRPLEELPRILGQSESNPDADFQKPPRIAVIIPTYNRGTRIFETLRRIESCDPKADEIWIHVDAADGKLEVELANEFPAVHILRSKERVGPGGGRHRCLLECSADYAVSFDDDSHPVDDDFFKAVSAILERNPRIAVLEAQIWQRDEVEIARCTHLTKSTGFTGCGHAVRVAAYRALPGYLPSPIPYNIEETDFALQLFSTGWEIYKSGELRVFHDTDLKHHRRNEIVAGTISNVALFAFINYPVILWPYALLQLANTLLFCVRDGRLSGILNGLAQVPIRCYHHRHDRRALPVRTILRYLCGR